VAQCIQDMLDPLGVGVIAEAQHFCMMMRGVEKQHSGTVTSTMLGAFRKNKETRNEFSLPGTGISLRAAPARESVLHPPFAASSITLRVPPKSRVGKNRDFMNFIKRYILTAMLAGAFSASAFAQGMPLPPGIAAETRQVYTSVKTNLIAAANAMPEAITALLRCRRR